MSRDNWERVVGAVLKREQLWQLFHQHSTSPSNISTSSSDQQIFSFPTSPSPPVPSENIFVSQESNHALGSLKRKLLSAWSHTRKTKDQHLVDIPGPKSRIDVGQVRRFTLHELQIATQNFGSKIKYGYSMVYKGQLENGRHVAVKRYRKKDNQNAEEKFREEVEMNCIALHPCVLNMIGLCTTANENLLVYPLMLYGTVDSCLRGRQKSKPALDWPTRKRIAVRVARGLAYLHDGCEKKIIHRDIKAANILLDEDFEAVIGDFELAVIMEDNVTSYRSTVGKIQCVLGFHVSN